MAPAYKRPSQSATRARFATSRGRFHVCKPGPFGNARTTVSEVVRGRLVLWRSAPQRGVCREWLCRALVD